MAKVSDLFFDTSALLKYYHQENGTRAVRFWINELRRERRVKAQFLLPNICIPEVLSVFYVLRHISRKINDDLLKNLRATFINDVRTRKLLPCNLSRQDIVATDQVYEVAHEIYRSNRRPKENLLSAMDIMIVAMALNFTKKHPSMFLVTADRQMQLVASKLSLPVLNPTNFPTIPDYLKP